ncbi:antibiotic biosynthesis monooxygenase, partial [Listeria monocytogenes]|nr:antibiotic biosynthesis monooxygenase [Listeria monocytogenes]
MYLKEKKNYLYCTAVIQTTGKVSYEQLVEHLEALRTKTVKEPGCVLFEIIPLESVLG